jgi:hypothetical protein
MDSALRRVARTVGRRGLSLGLGSILLLGGCTTLPSCAWGKCAHPRSRALIPQMSERVYSLPYVQIYDSVRAHLERRGYPLQRVEEDVIETAPYAEKEFAKALGLRYQWQIQMRKMDTLNTAVLPRLYVYDHGKPPRELSPGLWPEPYRYLYYDIERSLHELIARRQDSQKTP